MELYNFVWVSHHHHHHHHHHQHSYAVRAKHRAWLLHQQLTPCLRLHVHSVHLLEQLCTFIKWKVDEIGGFGLMGCW